MKSAGQIVWCLSLSGRLDRGRFRGFQTGWHDSANAKPPRNQGPRTKKSRTENQKPKTHTQKAHEPSAGADRCLERLCGFRLLQRCECGKHDAPCFFWQCASQRGNWVPTNIGCWPLLPSCDLLSLPVAMRGSAGGGACWMDSPNTSVQIGDRLLFQSLPASLRVVVFGQSPPDSWFRRDTECVEMSGLGVTSTVRAMLASPSPGCWSADAVWRGVPQATGYGIRQGVSGRRATRTRMTTSEASRVGCRVQHSISEKDKEDERARDSSRREELSSKESSAGRQGQKSLGPERGGKGGGVVRGV